MKFRLSKSFFIFLVITMFMVSCRKDITTEKPVVETDKIKEQIVILEETTKKIENSLSTGDHAAFLGFFSPKYASLYKDAVQKNSQKLVQFNEVFKSRKLMSCNEFFAVYQVTYQGKPYEITMFLDDDGKWKLKDM